MQKTVTALILTLGLAIGAPALADAAADAEAIAALQALAKDPSATQPPVLESYNFKEATYLIDGLTRNEIRALGANLYKMNLELPSNIDGAIRAAAPRPNGGRG